LTIPPNVTRAIGFGTRARDMAAWFLDMDLRTGQPIDILSRAVDRIRPSTTIPPIVSLPIPTTETPSPPPQTQPDSKSISPTAKFIADLRRKRPESERYDINKLLNKPGDYLPHPPWISATSPYPDIEAQCQIATCRNVYACRYKNCKCCFHHCLRGPKCFIMLVAPPQLSEEATINTTK